MKPRILAVDDDSGNLALLTAKLEKEGYEVANASNGLEALREVSAFHPDLVIMDVTMPQMDGYEALRNLKSREETRYIPVIMLTGRAEIKDKVMGFEVGAEDYINKPYSLQEVSARVKALLRMRALQNKLREAEKVGALGEMVDGIAHEIRNPLTAIGGMARRLFDAETNPRNKEYAEQIMKSVERLERMIQRVDEYKLILVSTLQPGDIDMVINAAIRAADDFIERSGKKIVIKTSLMPDPPQINLDYMNMKTAIYNILQNSVEAIESEGEIKVETLPSIDQTVAIRISDNGTGISQEDLRKIFNPFHSGKFQGAGMGLTISYRIIQDHGGEVEVESVKGEGTTVTIRLHPVAQVRAY